MLIIGHRGAMKYEPENTLRSIAKAVELGADMVEMDVYKLASGELAVIHDQKVNRTTDGQGYVWDQTFEGLRALDAGEGERVPTLEEALDTVNGRVPTVIELKGPDTAAAVAAVIAEYRRERGWAADRFLVSSFNHPELKAFKDAAPDVDTMALIWGIPLEYAGFAEELGAAAVGVRLAFVNREFVDDAHRRGIKVYVHTVNAADDFARMEEMDVDGVITNAPDMFGVQ